MTISFKKWLISEELSISDMSRLLDIKSIIKGPFKFYHAAVTGPSDSYLHSFQKKGALPFGSGHGQGGGFFVYTDIPDGLEKSKKHAIARGSNKLIVSGSQEGDPMVIEIEVPELDFDQWDLDLELGSIDTNPLLQLMQRKGTIEKLKKLGKIMFSKRTLDYLAKDRHFWNSYGSEIKMDKRIKGIDFSNPTRDHRGDIEYFFIDNDGNYFDRRPGKKYSATVFLGTRNWPDPFIATDFAPVYYGFRDAEPEMHKKLEAWWFSVNYGKKLMTLKYTENKPLKPTKILVYKDNEWIDQTQPKENNQRKISPWCSGKYWGISGAGILPYCAKTKRFLPNKRSAAVMQGGTYGIFGGGIFMKDALTYGVKSHEELLETPEAFERHAKQELREETGYNKSINLKLLYVFKDEECMFHYHNFLGIVSEEFKPQAESEHAWENEGTDSWVTYDELIKLEPKHFGLKALLQNAGDELKALGGPPSPNDGKETTNTASSGDLKIESYLEYKYLSGIIGSNKYYELANHIQSIRKIIFRKSGDKDLGACIGIPHGGTIDLPENIIERIREIKNLHFVAEGVAAKDHSKEPHMMSFINEHFPGYTVESKSWDDITEENNKGTANPQYNIVYTFMQHEFNNYMQYYTYDKGTMLDAMANPTKKNWPPNSPQNPLKRKKWLEFHMGKAGFLEKLKKPYNKDVLFQLLDEMEHTVYPPGQQEPNISTYFGKMQIEIENERNATIYDLMENGAVCIAGHGHIDELKTQFPDLEFIH